LSFDEGVEIGIGEHLARAALAVADDHVAERARFDMAVERLDRAAEFGGGLGLRTQAIKWANAGLARGRAAGRAQCVGRQCLRHAALTLGGLTLPELTRAGFALAVQVREYCTSSLFTTGLGRAGVVVRAEQSGNRPIHEVVTEQLVQRRLGEIGVA
jgi:hypothetical protein